MTLANLRVSVEIEEWGGYNSAITYFTWLGEDGIGEQVGGGTYRQEQDVRSIARNTKDGQRGG